METSPSTISPLFSFPLNFIVYLVQVSAILCHTVVPTSQVSSQGGLHLTLSPPISLYVLFLYYWEAFLLDQGSRERRNYGKEM